MSYFGVDAVPFLVQPGPASTTSGGNVTTGPQTFAGLKSFNAGEIDLTNGAANIINWGLNGFGAPTFTTRSAGQKIVFYPALSASQVDWGFGLNGIGGMFASIPQNTAGWEFCLYGGTTKVWAVRGDGYMTLTAPQQLASYTVGTLPAASVAVAQLAYASNSAVAPCVAFSNGTVWKRCDNAATTVI